MLMHKSSVVARIFLAAIVMTIACSAVSADFLVAWRDSYKVARYDNNWNYIEDFITLAWGTRPMGLAQDKTNGNVYVRVTTDVSGPTAGSVLKYDHHGNLISGWSVTGLGYGKALAVRDGKVFIGDETTETLKWYSTSDSSVFQALSSGADPMGPTKALDFDSQGKLFSVTGTAIKRWNADLSYDKVLNTTSNATDIKITPGTDTIRVLRWDGYLLGWDNNGTWTGPYYYNGVPPYPQALWLTSDGKYLRSATGTAGIQRLDTSSGTWQTLVAEGGGYTYPMAITDFEIIAPKLQVGVFLEDYAGDLSLVRLRVDVLQGETVVASTTITPDTIQPVVEILVDPGTYTVRASASKWITKQTSATLSGLNTTPVSLSLPNGDLDGNNHIGTVDFSALSANYGQTGE